MEFFDTGNSLIGWAAYGVDKAFTWIGNTVTNAWNDFLNELILLQKLFI